MLVDIAEHNVAFQERREAAAGARYLESRIDRVGKCAGVAQQVAGRHAGCIGHSKSWKQRMTVAQVHAVARDRRHSRSEMVVDHAGTRPSAMNSTTLCGRAVTN